MVAGEGFLWLLPCCRCCGQGLLRGGVVQSWWLQLMLCDVTFHILQPGPCGLAGDFQPKDCHGEVNGGCDRNWTLSHRCLVLPWEL